MEENATAFLFGERGKYAPQGVVGGEDGAKNRFYFDIDDKNLKRKSPHLVSKITGVKLKRGQRVRLETPGGGGYGDLSERSKELKANDLKQGYVSKEC